MPEIKFLGLRIWQPFKGVPVLCIQAGKHSAYIPFSKPVKIEKVSDNESYAIYASSRSGKLTVKTSGSGNIRTDVKVTFEEVQL